MKFGEKVRDGRNCLIKDDVLSLLRGSVQIYEVGDFLNTVQRRKRKGDVGQ